MATSMRFAALALSAALLAVSSAAEAQNSINCASQDGHDNNRTQRTLAIDPTNPSTLWIGVEYGGVFKSVDGGTTWKRADTGITGYADARTAQRCIQEMGKIIVDPRDSNHVLMSRVESPGTISMMFSENAGVWETRNGGGSWSQLIKGDMNASGSQALALGSDGSLLHGVNNNPASWGGAPDTLYNTVGILYHSADGGATWRELPTGAPRGLRATAVFSNPADPRHIWYVVLMAPTDRPVQGDDQWTYVESRDGGETWERGVDKFPFAGRIPADAAVSSRDFSHRLMSAMALEGPQSTYVTLNGGTSWTQASHHMFTARYDPHDATGMHLVGYGPYTNQPGLFESRDGGISWLRLADTPAEVNHQSNFGVRVSEIVWHPTIPNVLYMSASGGYVWRSSDGGRNWTTIFTVEQMQAITDVVQAPATPAPPPTADGRPVFSVPFVAAEQAVAFYIFGTTLPSGVQNPTFEIETADPSPEVKAVAGGFVVNVAPTSRGDFSVFILPTETSPWVVAYDHVNNVTVTRGQTVEAGAVLGTVGVLGNGRGRTELQINLTGQTPELAYCPTQFGTEAFNAAFVAAAQRVNGSPTVCLSETVVP